MNRASVVDSALEFPGPILVLAGPGTGKTFSLAKRIRFLVEEMGVSPDQISAITFTGEAAANLRGTLSDEANAQYGAYLDPARQPDWIRTMHSLGHEVCAQCSRRLGLRKGWRVVTARRVLNVLAADAASLCRVQRRVGGEVLSCRMMGKCRPDGSDKCRTCEKYVELLLHENALDYDDLLLSAVSLMNSDECRDVAEELRQHTVHLLIDEYQDINPAQYRFIRLLCAKQEDGLFAVGDDDQSIYGWRGGSPAYILRFERAYGANAKVRELAECRRCPPKILGAALSLIEKNTPNRRPKPGLHSTVKREGEVITVNSPSALAEARFIASKARDLVESHSVLVLVPRMDLAGSIKKAFRKAGVGYECRIDVDDTGLSFLDLMSDWIEDKSDDLSLRLCIERIVANRDLRLPLEEGDTKEGFLEEVSRLWDIAAETGKPLVEALAAAATKHECMSYVLQQLESAKPTSRPDEYLKNMTRVLRPWASSPTLCKEVSEWVDDGRARSAAGGNVVRILSMQKAKGLSVDYVFIVGLEQGIFPRAAEEDDRKREDRRLMYVSMTRARRGLFLCHARKRPGNVGYGAVGLGDHEGVLAASQFLDEIDARWVKETSWR